MYNLSIKEVLRKLNTSFSGVSDEEARNILAKYGSNILIKERKTDKLEIFIRQFKDFIVIILIVALIISLLVPIYEKGLYSLKIKDFLDAIVIFAILILNALLGYFQEYKAEKAIALLRELSSPKARVVREGKEKIIDAKHIVPGDIILLEEGDRVNADARLFEAFNLEINESTLTGESLPVEKQTNKLEERVEVADQSNMVFSGTIATKGRGKAIVANTGMNTEIGKIAKLIQKIEVELTPLQKRLKNLSKFLGLSILFICLIIFLAGIIRNIDLIDMFMTSLSLAVAAVPEGLPAIITVSLALGARRMLKRNSLIRKLKAVETLGSMTVICSDKTGTITKNEMTATELFVDNKILKVTGKGYSTKGSFYYKNKLINPKNFNLLFKICASCNNATLTTGDPTEIALLVLAKKANVEREERIDEIPFSSENKYMMTVHKLNDKIITYIKGAPEKVIELCDYINTDNKIKRFTRLEKEFVLKQNQKMASNALRVLAAAYEEENKKTFVGLIGLIDPPREEVASAIRLCQKAGIRTIMITGDQRLTAKAIAEQVGITGDVIEGKELDQINDDELKDLANKIGVYARVNPIHKVKILTALKENGEVVAMTGDGVNDAPALKKADVGVAMSIKGTDVSREASDMVLLDDNFTTIVSAVKEGRTIYDNIRKFIIFLLAANFGEIGVILISLLARLPLPLLPLQILWINLVTDGFPALALGVEPPSKKIMERKPRNPKESILKGALSYILIVGVLATIATITAFSLEYFSNNDLIKVRTMALTTLVLFELFFVFSCKSVTEGIFKIGFFSNMYLIYAVLFSLLLHLSIIYTPLNIAFKLIPLNLLDWLKIIALSSIGFIFFEVKKYLRS